jgi:tape measure domain-containing protein
MNVAFTLTADPVPVEQAFQRAGIASQKTTQLISQDQKDLQSEIDRLSKKLSDMIAIQEKGGTIGASAQGKLSEAINRTARELSTASQRAQNLGQIMSREITKETGLINTLNIRLQRLRVARDQSNDPARIQRINDLIQAQTARVQQLSGATQQAGKQAGFFSNQLKGIGAMVAGAFTIQSIIQFSTKLKDAEVQIVTIKNLLEGLLHSNSLADAKFNELMQTANDLGLEFTTLAQGYTEFTQNARQQNITLSESDAMYKKLVTAISGAHLSTQQANSSMLAITQMMGKGKISAQELILQLGQAMPGAIGILAKEMNVTTAQLFKMMENGELLASTTLPKLAEGLEKVYGPGAQLSAESLVGLINQSENAWIEFSDAMSKLNPTESWYRAKSAILKRLATDIRTMIYGIAMESADAEKKILTPAVQDEINNRIELQRAEGKSTLDIRNGFIGLYNVSRKREEAIFAQVEEAKTKMALSTNEAQRAILQRTVVDLSKSLGQQRAFSEAYYRASIDLSDKAKNEKIKVEKELTEAERKELEKRRKAEEKLIEDRKKAQKDLFAYLNSPEAQQNRTATVTVPEFAKDLGTGTEDRAVQAAKELQETADAQLTIFNALISDLDHSRAMDEMSEEEYLNEKLRLQQEYAQDVNKTTEEIYNFKKRKSQEELELEREKLMMVADTALALTGVYSNALEKQQIDLAKSREAGAITEEQYQQQVAQIKRKEFEVARIAALAQIAINTAISASASSLNPALLPFVIGFGVAQATVVATQPNPYAEGTKRVKGGQLGKDSVPYKEYNGQDALLMPGEMIVPTKRVNQHAPYLDNMFDGKISGTQSKWASDLFVSGRLDPGLLHFIASHTGMPIQGRSNDRSIVNAINRKAVPSFTRDANRIVDAINRTAPNNHRRWTR